MTTNPFETSRDLEKDAAGKIILPSHPHEADEAETHEAYDPPEESIFKEAALDPQDESFRQDPSDFSDLMARDTTMKRVKFLLSIVFVVAVVGFFAWLGLQAFQPEVPQEAPSPQATATTSTPTPLTPQKEAEENNPLLQAYPDAPTVIASTLTVALEGETATASNGASLTFTGSALTPASTACKVVDPTDFCLAGRLTHGDLKASLFFLKDAAHSRMFENPPTHEMVEVAGAQVAALLPLDLGAEDRPSLVVVHPDASGWIIMLEEGTPEALAALVPTLQAS